MNEFENRRTRRNWWVMTFAVAAAAATMVALRVPDSRIAAGAVVGEEKWRKWAEGDLHVGLPDSAAVTVVQFCDLTCGNCSALAANLDSIRNETPDVAMVYRHAILVPDELTMAGALALTCAGKQGRFIEAYREIFADPISGADTEDFIEFAKRINVSWKPFVDCIDDGATHREIAEDRGLAASIGVTATPVLLVNGHVVMGNPPIERLRALIGQAREGSR